MSKAKSDYLFARSAKSLIWSRMCIVSAGVGPIGGRNVIIWMKVQRYKCKNEECDYDQQENIPFATGSFSYTHRFAKFVVELLRGMTLQDVANHLNVSWDTVKEIHSTYLQRHYCPPSLKGVRNIGIDGFAVIQDHRSGSRCRNYTLCRWWQGHWCS